MGDEFLKKSSSEYFYMPYIKMIKIFFLKMC